MKQKIRLILEYLVESPYRNNAYDYALEQIRSLIQAEKQDCGSNIYGCAWNDALDRVLELLK